MYNGVFASVFTQAVFGTTAIGDQSFPLLFSLSSHRAICRLDQSPLPMFRNIVSALSDALVILIRSVFPFRDGIGLVTPSPQKAVGTLSVDCSPMYAPALGGDAVG